MTLFQKVLYYVGLATMILGGISVAYAIAKVTYQKVYQKAFPTNKWTLGFEFAIELGINWAGALNKALMAGGSSNLFVPPSSPTVSVETPRTVG